VRARGLCGFAPSDQWRLLLAVHRRRSCWAVTRAALQGPRSSYSRVAESAHGSARGDVIAPRRPASSCCCCSRCRRCLLLLVRRAVHPAATPCPAVLRTLHHGGDCAGTPEPLSTYYSLPLARTVHGSFSCAAQGSEPAAPLHHFLARLQPFQAWRRDTKLSTHDVPGWRTRRHGRHHLHRVHAALCHSVAQPRCPLCLLLDRPFLADCFRCPHLGVQLCIQCSCPRIGSRWAVATLVDCSADCDVRCIPDPRSCAASDTVRQVTPAGIQEGSSLLLWSCSCCHACFTARAATRYGCPSSLANSRSTDSAASSVPCGCSVSSLGGDGGVSLSMLASGSVARPPDSLTCSTSSASSSIPGSASPAAYAVSRLSSSSSLEPRSPSPASTASSASTSAAVTASSRRSIAISLAICSSKLAGY
jgi:hypothetical protein